MRDTIRVNTQWSASCSSDYGGMFPFEFYENGRQAVTRTTGEGAIMGAAGKKAGAALNECTALDWLHSKMKWCELPDNAKWPPEYVYMIVATSTVCGGGEPFGTWEAGQKCGTSCKCG